MCDWRADNEGFVKIITNSCARSRMARTWVTCPKLLPGRDVDHARRGCAAMTLTPAGQEEVTPQRGNYIPSRV